LLRRNRHPSRASPYSETGLLARLIERKSSKRSGQLFEKNTGLMRAVEQTGAATTQAASAKAGKDEAEKKKGQAGGKESTLALEEAGARQMMDVLGEGKAKKDSGGKEAENTKNTNDEGDAGGDDGDARGDDDDVGGGKKYALKTVLGAFYSVFCFLGWALAPSSVFSVFCFLGWALAPSSALFTSYVLVVSLLKDADQIAAPVMTVALLFLCNYDHWLCANNTKVCRAR
jgi:hypothetical protein